MTLARKARNERRLALILPVLGICAMLQSGSPARAESNHAESWTQVEQTELDFLFVRTGTEFHGFDRVMIDSLSVWHPGRQRDDQHIARMRHTFETSFARSLELAGFAITDRPGRGVLRLHVEVIDLKHGKVDDTFLDQPFLFDVSPGRITLVAELKDSLSGEVLLRLADMEAVTGANASEQTRRAFDDWSAQFGSIMLSMSAESHEHRDLMAQRTGD